jgi:hypothetical protein
VVCTCAAASSVLFLRHAFFLRGLLRRRKFIQQFLRRHFQRRILFEPRIERRIVNGLGVELFVDPFLEAHFSHGFDIAWTRAVRETIERVQNGFIFAEFGDRKLAFEGFARFGGCGGSSYKR